MTLNPASIKALLLDMDGVVIDSEPLHERAQHVVFARHGLVVPAAVMPTFKGLTEDVVFTRIVRDYAPRPLDPARLVEEKNQVYRDLAGELALVPGLMPFLERAATRYPVALTTSSVRRDQQRAFDKFGLEGFFTAVVTAEDITRPKPDPEPYRVTAARLGLPPGACLVVEDSVNGVRSGVGAGCVVAGLTTSFDAPTLRAAGAHATVDSFAELARYLGLDA